MTRKMRSGRVLALALVAAPLACAPMRSPSPRAPAPVSLRVLTYNIHHGEGRDGVLDLARLARVMKEAEPDLIALQEVDRGTARAGGVDQLATLASLLGMHAEYGKTMDFGGGAYGVAVLSRWPIERVENRPLPFSEDHEPRTALTVHFRAGGDGPAIRFTCTHLDNAREAEERVWQAEALNALLALEDDEPSILAGDFNARPGTEVLQVLDGHWANALPVQPDTPPGPAPTPANGPPPPGPQGPPGQQQRRGPRGDFVLYRPSSVWRVLESRTLDENVASDHRPVLTVLEWNPRPVEPAEPAVP